MTTQLEIFDICLNNIKNDWSITKQQIDDKFTGQIDANIAGENYKDGDGYIRINEHETILNTTGLTAIIEKLNDLETKIDDQNATILASSAQAQSAESESTLIKNTYLDNKAFYIQNKDKVHGALIQAKTQNDNYNILISSSINLICGILIVSYLIYQLYSPITVEEIKTAVKTTSETATKVAKQAQASTNKIVSGK